MKKINDFALVAITVILLVGLFFFRNYNRYELERGGDGLAYALDTRTGELWMSVSLRELKYLGQASK